MSLLALAAAAPGMPLPAQMTAQAKARVALQIRPRVGDTIALRMEQRMDVTLAPQGRGDPETMTTSTTVLSRAIVQDASETGTTILAVTDSVAVSSNEPDLAEPLQAMRKSMQGMRSRFRIAPDGGISALDIPARPSSDYDVQALLSQMPATLPRRPVAVGDSWTSSMPLPMSGGDSTAATMVATFRLDSLSDDGGVAYISTRGHLERAASEHLTVAGTMTGTLVFQRRRGWVTESTLTFDTKSVATPKAAGAAPLRVQMKLTQRMRVVP